MGGDVCRCAMSNNKIAGLQYGTECWCSAGADGTWGKYGKLSDNECNTPCAGKKSIMCGGDLKNSVYRVTRRMCPAISISLSLSVFCASLSLTDRHYTSAFAN